MLQANYAYAEQLITKPFTLSAKGQTQFFSVHHLIQPQRPEEKNTYTLFYIDDSGLKHQISIYKRLYFAGQIFHGVLMLKARPIYNR